MPEPKSDAGIELFDLLANAFKDINIAVTDNHVRTHAHTHMCTHACKLACACAPIGLLQLPGMSNGDG